MIFSIMILGQRRPQAFSGICAPGLALCMLLLLPGVLKGGERPNVLFLFTDDQRFDTIHALGNERIKTPNIDRLVETGLSFTNAYIMGGTSMAVCTPSRASLFSGRTLWNLECQGPWDFAIPERYPTMAEVFRNAGYTTFSTGKNDPGFGKQDHFKRSFSAGDNLYYRGGHRGQDRTPMFRYPDGDDGLRGEKIPVSGKFNADLFADACIDFLASRKDDDPPFFAYVSFMTPHDPLNCPQEYLDMYQPGDVELPGNFLPQHPFDAGVHHIRDEKLFKRPLKEEALRQSLARYYALVTHTDAQIGRILDALEQGGEESNTIVVFSSDNGLALGSHGLTGKQNVYEHSVRVPFIMAGPGVPRGQVRDQLCYLYDVYPTLCELAGLEVPVTVQFSSLKPAIMDAQAKGREHLYFSFMSWQRSVRDDRYKLIEYSVDGARKTQLFDLREDPEEKHDLSTDSELAPVLNRMRKVLLAERDRLNDGASDSPHAREMSEAFWRTFRGGDIGSDE